MPDDSAPIAVAPAAESPLARRRADVDAKQRIVARHLADLECEAAILLMPAHVAWLSGGLTARGLFADTERPGIYTNGTQRWLLAANVDTLRFFDEEIDGLGFLLKEWSWTNGRGSTLGDLIAGKRVAVDRPYPNLPLLNERLRNELRPLTAYEHEQMFALGRIVVHALEATAREMAVGETEADVAGSIAHRLLRRGAIPEQISVTADDRGLVYRRTGSTQAPIVTGAILQATASQHGLYATAARTVHFGPVPDDYQSAFTNACKLAAVFRSMTRPGESTGSASEAGKWLLAGSAFEFEYRLSQPGYGTGRLAAEELRRMGHDEPFGPGQAIVWQARLGPAAVVDTVIVSPDGPQPVTPPDDWPFKRIRLKDRVHDIPDILVR
jgi:Xaa-Pro aminopeptidase